MHEIAQRPAQMRMCSHDDNKEKNLFHPFWVEISRFQHKKKIIIIILYCIISLTRQKKKLIGKEEKKELYTHYTAAAAALQGTFPSWPLK